MRDCRQRGKLLLHVFFRRCIVMATDDQTKAVLMHHLDSLMALDFAEVLSDYTEESVVISPAGTVHGLEAIQGAMGEMAGLFTPESLSQLSMLYQDIQGEVAYLAWTMGDVVPFGTDTFIIRNGKIAVQTIGMHVPQA